MDLRESMRCQTDVSLNITKHLFSKEEYQDKNLIFSPFTLHAALSVMAAASQDRTLHELLSFLRFDSVDHLTTFFSHLSAVLFATAAPSSHHLSFVNGMWVDKSVSLSHSFKQLVATHYKASLSSLDFQTKGDQAHHQVNSWVENKTYGLITDLLPPNAICKLTRLIFANALHFKGVWKHNFDVSKTYHRTFHLLNGTSVEVPFMRSTKETQYIRAFDGFKVLRLSYKQGGDKKRRFSMCIFLPDAKDGLRALIEKFASQPGFLKGKLPRRKMRVSCFMIPKFKISFTLDASNVLKELGVVSPFSQHDADFTKIVEVNSLDKLHVENIFHKTFIEVTEEGTKATSANSMIWPVPMGCTNTIRTGIDFVADHPFLFLIREDLTGTVLFIGQMLNPLDGAAKQEVSWRTKCIKLLRREMGVISEISEEEDEGDDNVDDLRDVWRIWDQNTKKR